MSQVPRPTGAWTSRQTWHDVLFAHWPVPASALRSLVPPSLDIDEHDGTPWVSLIPFRMTGVTPRFVPPMPGLSAFAEMNLRLYITHRGRPGIWFISLDAASAPAVWAARRFFHLPYFHASMDVRHDGERVQYRSERRGATPAVDFAGTYGPTGPASAAAPGTLAHFLAERYRLYTTNPRGELLTVEIHHPPWPLQPAAAEIEINTVATAQGIAISGPPAVLHFARRLDVRFWPMRKRRRV